MSSPVAIISEDQQVLKEARARCYKSRDAFYSCVADSGVTFTIDSPIPHQCHLLRSAYEKSCKPSWVRHFDQSQDKELRLLQTLRSNINKSASTATGNLAGTDQRTEQRTEQ